MSLRHIVLALTALVLPTIGCDRGDVRPWMVCYRIYDQCKEAVGPLNRLECESIMANKTSVELEALVNCVRDNPCPGVARRCHPGPHKVRR